MTRLHARVGTLVATALVAAAMALLATPDAVGAAAPACITAAKGAPVRATAAEFNAADVWIYGDSLTYQTRRSLAVYRAAIDAHWGRTTKGAVDNLAHDLAKFRHKPKVVVMAVGTNDRSDPKEFLRQVNRALKLTPKSIRVLWVNAFAYTGPNWRPINAAISRFPRIEQVRWAESQHPGYLRLDGLHVTGKGCDARNALIRKALLGGAPLY